ncbi:MULTISPECIES: iron-sulfur cluster repair di-iron protein [Bacillus]|uniref:iron-sulfur cluster repair di-iron protein n=1 Tax=Bacillus TaxID=1386 RepID=UPI000BB8189C|nr:MULTISPECIES: iron-sulfur cluster repair di-iron protein [Bacillus]
MANVFHEQSNVGEIVAKFPKAGDYFKSVRIDFCCGGNRPLIEAINERNLDSEEVINDINTLYEDAQRRNEIGADWQLASFEEIIDIIIQKHHQFLQEELPALSPYVTKVLRVHGHHQPHLAEIHSLFYELKKELEQHTIKEETVIFPAIMEAERTEVLQATEELASKIKELEDEHDAAGDIMKRLREITNDFQPPEGACGTYQLVYRRLAAIEDDLFNHVHLENNVLFPKARDRWAI